MTEAPEYELDHETISRYGNMIEIVERLVDYTSRPNFDRERRYCRVCLEWTISKGEARRPRRMGAKDPTESCSGCVLSMLELVGDPGNPVDIRAELDRVNLQINDIERSKHMRKQHAERLAALNARARGLRKRLEEEEDRQQAEARRHRPRVMWDREPGVQARREYIPLPVRQDQQPGDLRRRYILGPLGIDPGLAQGELRAGAVNSRLRDPKWARPHREETA